MNKQASDTIINAAIEALKRQTPTRVNEFGRVRVKDDELVFSGFTLKGVGNIRNKRNLTLGVVIKLLEELA